MNYCVYYYSHSILWLCEGCGVTLQIIIVELNTNVRSDDQH